MKDGHLTLLIVPEDERDVRRIRVSYRALRRLGLLAGALVALAGVGLVSYGSVIARAGRAALLERENRRLEAESAKVGRIVDNLERSERTYLRIRDLAGLEDLPAAAVAADADGPEPAGPDPRRVGGPVPAGWPLALKGFVTARFEGPDGHTGIDIAVPAETPVMATAEGLVREAGFDPVLGYYVRLTHGEGFETLYGHNARLVVEPGQRVERAEAIAFSGSSGRSSAPHLHYEVRRGGRAVDPDPYLR